MSDLIEYKMLYDLSSDFLFLKSSLKLVFYVEAQSLYPNLKHENRFSFTPVVIGVARRMKKRHNPPIFKI